MVLTRYLDPDLIERAVESAAYTHVALTDPGRIDEAMEQVRKKAILLRDLYYSIPYAALDFFKKNT